MTTQSTLFWQRMQNTLFPEFMETINPATEKHKEIAYILDLLKVEEFVVDSSSTTQRGRPKENRQILIRAFIAKAILNSQSTVAFLERLQFDVTLRRICGWIYVRDIPCEATFSNAFAEFAKSKKFEEAHTALIKKYMGNDLVFHISRDATAIEAREKKAAKEEPAVASKFPKGRPKKDEIRPEKELKRLEKQPNQTLSEMLLDLPTHCNSGAKTNSKGNQSFWNGYKLHLDVSDGGIPISALLTSASVHDSQVAIPLEVMTGQKVSSLYTLMDAAYNSSIIRTFIDLQGKNSIIAPKKSVAENEPLSPGSLVRFKNRTTAERTNSDLKDNHGGRMIRVRGASKVMAHLMAGVLVIAAKMLSPLL